MLKNLKKVTVENIVVLLLGNLLVAIGNVFFALRVNLVNGGLSGLSLLLNITTGINYSLIVFIGTWFFFFLGLIYLGKKFAFKTLLSSIVYPLFTYLCEIIISYLENVMPQVFLVNPNDSGTLIVYAIFAAIFIGVGVGMVFKTGGSTGGLDIPCLIFAKKFKFKVDKIVFLLDALVVLLSVFVVGLLGALVGIISAYLCGIMIDKAIVQGNEALMIHILSEKHQEINKFINYKMGRGTTYLIGIGGYSQNDKKILEVVIGRREYYILREEIAILDPEAFMIVIKAKDVLGLGFQKYKKEV